ncbi:unnamed protein product (mitochondrion) [Plasmodiophora brassicae]|uniref:Archease domain-containing protein n=1 Tax=Plasmodiophora brassicae TaxID=37360 RepID=A0A0G4IU68_PLABS|nr:hypothetical protein PBRA_006891 [Plasmodiophora brassicae]SPR00595.1 unnamed protein product [Plasmodiophora brassicae]
MSHQQSSSKERRYEYLPHTADIRFHSWGATTEEAFGNMAACMFSYMTDIESIDIDARYTYEFEVVGDDESEALYKFLDELLYRFWTGDRIACREVQVTVVGDDGEHRNVRVRARSQGEPFDVKKHPQGTEIKAITLEDLSVQHAESRVDAFVLVDI